MPTDILKKRIIVVHGLAAKPPEKDFHSLWQNSLIKNIHVDNRALAHQLDSHPEVLVSAYWANATPHHIENDAKYVKKLCIQVNAVIKERMRVKSNFHVGKGEKAGAFFKNRGVDVVKLLAGVLTVKDDVMKEFMRETKLYDEDQFIADKMRRPLEEALRSAWRDKCDIALITHSMGTFIAYDVLWRFSHRNVEGFRQFKNKRVRLFVTMGSPLGDPTVRSLLFGRHHKNKGKRQYPTNIDFWHNYSCLGDVVSHQHNFEECFFKSMRELGILPNKPKWRAIDYANLHNPFKVVTHSGNKTKEKRNPHSLHGYMVQPRLGTWVADFLQGKLRV